MRKIIAGGLAAILIVIAVLLLWPTGSGNTLIIYSGLDYGPQVAAAFTHKTGIKVKIIRLSTGSLLARISAQGHHPDWSLAWFDGATAAVSLDRAHLLARDLPEPTNLTRLGQTMLPANGAYVPTGCTLAGVFITPRAATFAPPRHWSDLTRPIYHGLIGMNDPSISGPTYPALAGMLKSAGGWPEGKPFIEALKADGLHIYAKNDATLAALRSGAIQIAIVQSSAALHFADSIDQSLRVSFPHPAYLLPNVLVMAPGLKPTLRTDAIRFIAYANSPAAQRIRTSQNDGDAYYWPIIRGAEPRAGMPPLASLDVATLNARRWGRAQNSITAWFAKRIVGAGS